MEAENREGGSNSYNPLNEPPHVTQDVVTMFYPLRGVDSDLWRSSLKRLQQQFLVAGQDAEKLTCVLTQSIIPEWPKRPSGPYPSEISGLKPVELGSGPSREPEQLFLCRQDNEETVVSGIDRIWQENFQLKILNLGQTVKQGKTEYEPIVGERMLCDVSGNPILFSNGEPVALQPGINRSYMIYANERPASLKNFRSFSENAGRTLYGLPASVNRVLWRDWLDGFTTIESGAMWVSALFELAWQNIPGSTLIAKKLAWDGTTSIPLDALPHLRQQAKLGAKIGSLDSITDPPAHWYSVIDDLMAASVAAIDILLAIGKSEHIASHDANLKQKKSGPPAKTIEDWERETPELDPQSVEWVPARKENAKKFAVSIKTLRDYRCDSHGGRTLPGNMFGIDRSGRRWRRQGTEKSTVYYFVPSLPKTVERSVD